MTGAGNTSVTWLLNPSSGAGTISGAGLYTAPSSIAATQNVTVIATSVADTSKTGTAAVTLNPPNTQAIAIFNTGVNTSGGLTGDAVPDSHYTLTTSADPVAPAGSAYVVNNNGFPIPPWMSDGPNSKWIAPMAAQGGGNQPGNYTFRTTFNLTGLNAATAVLNGQAAADNSVVVYLNGTAATASLGGFGSWVPFTINSGFVSGLNTLDFVLTNAPPGVNPTGLRVEIGGTAVSSGQTNYPPSAVSVIPNSGSGQNQLFTATYSDPNGASDLTLSYLLFNSSLSGTYGCWIYYDRAAFWLMNDVYTGWIGPLTPNSQNVIYNGQCTLSGSGSYATSNGNSLTMYANVAFSSNFSGTKNAYMYAADTGNLNSGWVYEGTWTVPSNIAVSVNPVGNPLYFYPGQQQQFTATVTGTPNTAVVWSMGANFSAGTLSSNGYWVAPSTVSSAEWIEIIATSQADATRAGVSWIYLQPAQPPSLDYISPTYGSGRRQMFTVALRDVLGAGNISWVQPFFSYSMGPDAGASGCHMLYYPSSNITYFDGDNGGNSWVDSSVIGPSGHDMSNSYCTVHAASSSISQSGTLMNLNIDVEFLAPAFGTYRYAYMSAGNNQGLVRTWQYFGWWYIP